MRIKDTVTQPSEALQAMIDGLEKQSKRDGFEIDMESFTFYADDM